MQLQNIEFLKQFRKETVELPFQDRQYRSVYFRHFSKNSKGKMHLEKCIEKWTMQSELIDVLIARVERGRIVDQQLTELSQKLLKIFASYRQKETVPCPYLDRLSAAIGHLVRVAHRYREEMQLPLLNTLKRMNAGKNDVRIPYVGCKYIRNMQIGVRTYLDFIYSLYDVFAGFLEKEMAIVDRLSEWKKRSRGIEVQQIYN